VTFVTAQDPTKRTTKQYSKKTTPNLTTTKITTNPTTITPNGTELDQNPKDYKSNHNNRYPEQQRVWSLNFNS
jgi:hypothetical protein